MTDVHCKCLGKKATLSPIHICLVLLTDQQLPCGSGMTEIVEHAPVEAAGLLLVYTAQNTASRIVGAIFIMPSRRGHVCLSVSLELSRLQQSFILLD